MAQRPPQGSYRNWNKYYSRVRFQFVRTGAGPYTFTMAAGTELRAFGYGIGQDISSAAFGFASGTTATPAETNLQQASTTLAGEQVRIFGLSLLPTSDSDSYLAKILWPNVSVQLALNGDQQGFKLGTPETIPGGGGLSGAGDSYIQSPPQQESYVSRSGALTNGVPHAGNFYPIPDPIVWNPAGANDGMLVIKLRVERAVTATLTERAAVAGGANTSGTAAFLTPAANAIGTYVTVLVHLWCKQLSARSVNI
jgi:hypothetical protein